MSSSPDINNGRLKLVSIGCIALFGAAVYSQVRVQVLESGSIQQRAIDSKRFVVTESTEPKRGRILSSDGKVLARDQGVYALHLGADKIPKTAGFYLELAEAAGMSASEVRELMSGSGRDIIWPPTLTAEQRKKIQAVKSKWRADNLSADATGERFYPLGVAASSVVGMIAKDGARKGIEAALVEEISGIKGQATGLVDRTGAFLPMRMKDETREVVHGSDVELTLDSHLQQVAFEAVKRSVESHKAEAGIAIVLEPKSGDVLAMANWPTYDPKNGQGPDGNPADFNPNIMGYWEPGSTMKILTEAKALEDGKVSTNWTSVCNGTLTKGPYRIQCDKHAGTRAHGTLDLERAIAMSCNVSAAEWACLIGYEPYRQFLSDLGFLSRPQIGLPYVKAGRIFEEEVAKTHQLMCWGFGQSLDVTPLNLAAGFSSLGNNGVWMQPRLIKSVGGVVRDPVEGKRVFSQDTCEKMMQYMEAVFDSERGTGKSLKIEGYPMAGKTGTAQRLGRGSGYVANFVGFLPAKNPKAMILVMIDHPTAKGYYGAQVAGPVYSEIARAVIRRFGIPPTSGTHEGVKAPVAPTVEVEVRQASR